ncbi:MAG: hypothetical protein HC828_11995 [Blastochloris sp.]|nr:hypothetical protein [Blastochloris sp.]
MLMSGNSTLALLVAAAGCTSSGVIAVKEAVESGKASCAVACDDVVKIDRVTTKVKLSAMNAPRIAINRRISTPYLWQSYD